MSQAPETTAGGKQQEDYLTAFSELAQRIRDGASFSGRERNCAFLNTADGTFADISSVSGFGRPDDARGLALTDWDHDGDLDLWISNRTAPRACFLQNRIPTAETQWIAIQLEGNPALKCPRDAIGSQVELVLPGASGRRFKTLHAGDGLMSQSTKWLHFGLGAGAVIEKVLVHWAGGTIEEFTGLTPGQRWRLAQGTATARPAAKRPPIAIDDRPLPLPPATDLARIRLSQPLKTPELTYRDFAGQTRSISSHTSQRAVLVNLWATWCVPCVAELKAFAEARAQLEKEGIEVLALNVDHLDPDSTVSAAEAAAALARLGFTMPAGMADPQLVDSLNQSILKSVYNHRTMPVPVSFLIDRGGWLSAIYKGPIDVAHVIADRRALGESPEAARAAALPFAGQWAEENFPSNPMTFSAAYLEGGYVAEARAMLNEYLAANDAPPGNPAVPAEQQRNMQLAGVHFQLGEIAILEQAPAEAAAAYRKSLRYNPKQIPALNNLAWLLSTTSHPDVRNGAEALQHATFMMQAPGVAENPTLLTTLAASYAAAGRFPDAVNTTRRIIEILSAKGFEDQTALHRERLLQFERQEALSL